MRSQKSLLKSLAEIPLLLLSIVFLLSGGCSSDEKKINELFNPATHDAQLIHSPTGDSWRLKDGALAVELAPPEFGSVIEIKPPSGFWDVSDYRFVRCEIENMGSSPQFVELGFGDYDLTLGGTLVPPGGKKILKAVIYRTRHPAYIDSVFQVMHGKPGGELRGWMDSTSDTVEYIKLLFPAAISGNLVKIGRIWLEKPYVLLTEEELKEKYYPFIDRFGQYMQKEWPDKIHDETDLVSHAKKEMEDLAAHPGSIEWNKYGGWKNGPRLTSTGRFRVEKYEGKWWFVDPDGSLFWSNGFDCVEFGRQTQTRVSGRESYFAWLPAEGSHEASLYAGTGDEKSKTRNLSFHLVNLYRKFGESWKETALKQIHDRLHSWGFNTIGNWSDSEIYLQRKTPYVLTINSKKTSLIADPYLPEYKEDLLELLSAKREELDDPWCIGVFIDNELKWGVKWAPKIAEQIQIAPEDQPAKIAFRNMLIKKYINIAALNKAWDTGFADWNEILTNRQAIAGAASDIKEFMTEFTTLYHSVCRNAVKELAPGLLYMGSRMDFHLCPEDTSLNYIIKIAAAYCDVVSFNRYRYTCAELIPPDGGDYPVIIGEYHFGSLETGLLQPGLRYAADQNERAELFGHYLESALENPYIIGAHWFQLVDQAVAGRGDGENYQAGFLTVGDVPQEEMISKSREIGYQMYQTRIKPTRVPDPDKSISE
ncbi:MAG TPA: hypothetical protein DCR40_08045 [Prolixibacteraceae bacterium]|nr:hypothetical protein [Prolixibacteraceae bacterium]